MSLRHDIYQQGMEIIDLKRQLQNQALINGDLREEVQRLKDLVEKLRARRVDDITKSNEQIAALRAEIAALKKDR
jgi:cell division protein FtsL